MLRVFGAEGQSIQDLRKINFFYGCNGSGKTTISRVIADEDQYLDCAMAWHHGTKMETLVYNRDFVEANFGQSVELPGIFTLGKKDKETLAKINLAKKELDELVVQLESLKNTLRGNEITAGKESGIGGIGS